MRMAEECWKISTDYIKNTFAYKSILANISGQFVLAPIIKSLKNFMEDMRKSIYLIFKILKHFNKTGGVSYPIINFASFKYRPRYSTAAQLGSAAKSRSHSSVSIVLLNLRQSAMLWLLSLKNFMALKPLIDFSALSVLIKSSFSLPKPAYCKGKEIISLIKFIKGRQGTKSGRKTSDI